MADVDSIKGRLIVRIIDRVEEQGIDRFDYVLGDLVDIDALTEMVDAGDPDEQVTLWINGLKVTVYGTGDVDVEPRFQ